MATEDFKGKEERRKMRKLVKVEYVFVGSANEIARAESKLLDVARMEECVSFFGEASVGYKGVQGL